MKFSLTLVVVVCLIIGGVWCDRVQAAVPVTWDGSAGLDVSSGDPDSMGKFRWEQGNWTTGGVTGQTASATMGNNNGGRGGMDISMGGGAQVYYDQNRKCPSSGVCVPGALGDFARVWI